MDFLKIRKQAKERSEARARARSTEHAPESIPPSNQADQGASSPEDREPPPSPPRGEGREGEARAAVASPVPSMMPLEEEPPASGGTSPHPLPDPPPLRGRGEEVLSSAREEEVLSPAGGEGMLSPSPPRGEGRGGAAPVAPEPVVVPAPPPAADRLAEFFFDPDEEAPGVPDLGGAAPAAQPGEPVEQRREYLAFRLGDEEYAFGIESIREILKAPPITEVPRAPAHVLGVITVRGEVIPVFDPRHRLGLPPAAVGPRGRVIVCDAGEGPCGLLVDAVAQVVRLPPSAIEQKPQAIGGSAEYISGIGRDRDRLFILLDLAAVLRFPRVREAVPA